MAGRWFMQLARFSHPEETDKEGRTPLMHCCSMSPFFPGAQIVALGLMAQMQTWALDLQVHSGQHQRGFCALHFVAGPSSYETSTNEVIVRELIRRRATMELRTDAGLTPLLFAVSQGQTNVAKALVELRADVNAHSYNVEGKGKTVRNIMDFGGSHSGDMNDWLRDLGHEHGIVATGNKALRDNEKQRGGEAQLKRREERWVKAAEKTRGSASSSAAGPKAQAGPWVAMSRRAARDWGDRDPRIRHTGEVGAAVQARLVEEHGEQVQSTCPPPPPPSHGAEEEPMHERIRHPPQGKKLKREKPPDPDAEPTRRRRREEPQPEEPRPLAQSHGGEPWPERRPWRIRAKRRPQ